MADEQDLAESLDDDKLAGDYPPDQPLGVDTYGTTAAEERYGEPLVEALAREQPDREGSAAADAADAAIADEVPAAEADIVQEREGAPAAEEVAVHVVSEDDLPAR